MDSGRERVADALWVRTLEDGSCQALSGVRGAGALDGSLEHEARVTRCTRCGGRIARKLVARCGDCGQPTHPVELIADDDGRMRCLRCIEDRVIQAKGATGRLPREIL